MNFSARDFNFIIYHVLNSSNLGAMKWIMKIKFPMKIFLFIYICYETIMTHENNKDYESKTTLPLNYSNFFQLNFALECTFVIVYVSFGFFICFPSWSFVGIQYVISSLLYSI
ncbi:hypothetical protein DM860_006348 [Cuscuta australis]|uniref:Uncharacterized protein n=1 Tax=Cuscuta australis TaxID=267555 RepID=A0A328D730_9ASTE|nr:hypothetical protein DM860_006348 [Cuscuta australis]